MGVKVADGRCDTVGVDEGPRVGVRKVVGVPKALGDGIDVCVNTWTGEGVGERNAQPLSETMANALIAERTRFIVRPKLFVCARIR